MKQPLRLLIAWALLWVVVPARTLLAQTTTFSYTGAPQQYTVPTGVTRIQVTAVGAGGGRFNNSTTAAIAGGQAQAILVVTPGETLTVLVGGQGKADAVTNAGGYNGGGSGSGNAGGGGGATELRRATAAGASGDYLTTRNALLVAGGAGGNDQNGVGGGGGTPNGGDGVLVGNGTKGSGATQTAAGSGNASGSNNVGGNGVDGGGGGGGYYGGGGGNPLQNSAGGGGGSSWVTPTGSSNVSYSAAPSAANGMLTIVATPPTITAFAPAVGGLGQLVTLTGTNLTGVTSLVVNGVNATASITNNTATSLTFRVPVTSPATGTTSITTPNGSATSTAFTVMPAPGNALAFNGSNNSVTTNATFAFGTGNLTLEAWVRTTSTAWMIAVGAAGSSNEYWLGMQNQRAAFTIGNNTCFGSSLINDGRWHHLTGVRQGGVSTVYVDGVAETSQAVTNTASPGSVLEIGRYGTGFYWNGSIDEVRVWNVGRTIEQINSDLRTTPVLPQTGLVVYYNFDQGTPNNANAGLTTAYDLANSYVGTLNNFVLTGSTSNWVESYALVVPTATAATGVTSTNFTANWTAPAVGTVTNYLLDVSTSAAFTTPISGSPFTIAAGTTTRSVTGLTPGTTYYYRVRADKTSVTGQGAYSASIPVTTCTLPVAVAQNVIRALDANGTATLTATDLNNGSTAGCGPLTLQVQKLGVYGQVTEGRTLTLTAPAGAVFTAVEFASYGTPTGSEGNYTTSSCHATNSASVVESYLLGKNSASIPATNGVFGDPCVGTVKSLAVRATYTLAAPTSQVTYSCSEVGTNLVRLIVTDANGNTSMKTATVTVQDNLAPTAVAQNVSVTLDQSGNATITPAMVNVSSTDNCSITVLSVAPNTFSCTDVTPTAATNPSLAFNGSTQYVEGTHPLLPSGNAARTLEAWVYPTAANSNGVIFNYGTPSTNLRSGLIMSNGNLYYVGEFNDLRGNITLSLNAWHHVAATYDGITLRLYVDGILDVSTNPAAFNTTGTTWRMAQRAAPQSGEFLTGRLDEVRVWSRALLASEITQSASRINPTSLASLVARWDMREASGTSLSDMTGNSTPGTLYNTPVWTTPGVAYQGVMTTLTVTDASGNSSRAQATVSVNVPATATTTWNGSSSNSWLDCSNWSYGKVPDAATHVIIPANLSRYPSLTSGTLTAANVTIAPNATFTLGSAASLEVYGNWTNNGTATLAGTVSFRGAAAQSIGGSSQSSFAKLLVNKTGTLTLQRAATVTGTLTMTSGMLATGAYELTTTGASLAESSSSYVLGTTLSTATLNAAGTRYSFGNLGLALTPNGTTLPGNTTVRRVTGTALTGQGTSVSIKRYYDIQAATDAGLNVTLEFGYFDTELNGVTEGQLTLFRSSTGTTGPWQPVASSGRDATLNTVTASGVKHFSTWTLGAQNNPLPVELTSFTAKAQGTDALLHWTTAQEKNSAYFALESSADGVQFRAVGQVAAQGTSQREQVYQWRDANITRYQASKVYYRLRQVDQDSSAQYSAVQAVQVAALTPQLVVYPTHVTDQVLRYTFSGVLAAEAVLTIHNSTGQLVQSVAGSQLTSGAVSLPALPTGWYVVHLLANGKSYAARFYQP